MEEDEAVRVLFREISKRDLDSDDHAMATIVDMIENGKNAPIREIIDEEKQAKRQMLINDGDMSFISSDDEDFRWIDDFSQWRRVPILAGQVTVCDNSIHGVVRWQQACSAHIVSDAPEMEVLH